MNELFYLLCVYVQSFKYGVYCTVKAHLVLVPAIFQVVSNHRWLVTAILDSTALEVVGVVLALRRTTSSSPPCLFVWLFICFLVSWLVNWLVGWFCFLPGKSKSSELAHFFVSLILHLQNVLQTCPVFHEHFYYETLVFFLYPRFSVPEIKARLVNDGYRATAFPEMCKL